MKRRVLRPGETLTPAKMEEVGNGYQTWNKAIGASCGTLVPCLDDRLVLWADDNGLLVAEPQINGAATILAGQPIYGTVIVFLNRDVK